MKRFIQLGAKGLFGTAVAVTLGFGTAQATASPAQAITATCTHSACNDYCINYTIYDYGRCNSAGNCVCAFYMCGGQIC